MNASDFGVVLTSYYGGDGMATEFGPESAHSIEAIGVALGQYIWVLITMGEVDASFARSEIEKASGWICDRAIFTIDQLLSGDGDAIPAEKWTPK